MTISVICPLYKAEKYIDDLDASLRRQENVNIVEIKYIVTKVEEDKTISKLEKLNSSFDIVYPNEFSHSLTRENAARKAKGEIIVFITQDIIIQDENWLFNLTKDINEGNCEASFSKQISNNNTVEKYIRMKNYPNESRIVSKDDVKRLGIMTYFYSDASSAVRKDIYLKLNGYDGKKLLTNEDMYFSYKLINNGYRIKYCADSKVIHSHTYSYSSLFKRYFDQGVFLKQHKYIYDSGASSSALDLLKFTIISSIRDGNIKVLFQIVPNFAARFLGNKFGQIYDKLSREKILKFTGNIGYWQGIWRNEVEK